MVFATVVLQARTNADGSACLRKRSARGCQGQAKRSRINLNSTAAPEPRGTGFDLVNECPSVGLIPPR